MRNIQRTARELLLNSWIMFSPQFLARLNWTKKCQHETKQQQKTKQIELNKMIIKPKPQKKRRTQATQKPY